MKHFMKGLAKALTLIFMISFTIIPFAGCSNKSANKAVDTNQSAVGNIAEVGESDESAENVKDDESKKDEETTQIVSLDGIYQISRQLTYKDTWFENLEETIKFFQTRDINGIYNFLRMHDFENEVNDLSTKLGDKTYTAAIHFKDNKVAILLKEDGTLNFKVFIDYVEIETQPIKLEIDENKDVFLYYQWSYLDDAGTEIYTPLYVRCPITKIEGSENINVGNTFIYKNETAKIVIDGTHSITKEQAVNIVSNMFGIETDATNKTDAVVNILETWKFMVSPDLSKITILKTDGTFTYTNLSGSSYTIDNVTFELSKRVIDLETNTEKMVFVITVDNQTIFTFSFVAI